MKNSVSIITVNLNNAVGLEKTIRSVNSANGDKEIIVVDDGSSNLDCWNLVNKLSKEIEIKKLRYEQNKGKRYAIP